MDSWRISEPSIGWDDAAWPYDVTLYARNRFMCILEALGAGKPFWNLTCGVKLDLNIKGAERIAK